MNERKEREIEVDCIDTFPRFGGGGCKTIF